MKNDVTKVLGFYALHPLAKLPMKQTQGAACFDIHACCDDLITLNPGERALIPTGLIFDIPEDHSVRIHTRFVGGYQRYWSIRITGDY